MDDMKRLVERYKRELMEYSRAAKADPPAKLEFPEMTDESAPTQAVNEQQISAAEASASAPQKKLEIIGYSDNGDLMSAFSEMFISAESDPAPEQQAVPVTKEAEPEIPLPEIGEPPQITLPLPELTEDPFPGIDNISETEDYSGVSTVTPEKAEQIGDIPESGNFPDEQLGKRDFEEQIPVQNSRDDIQPLRQNGIAPPVAVEKAYNTLQEFVDVNARRGTVRFRTYTARGALPVAGASIVISKTIGGERHIFYTLTTDISGQTPIVSLPAPSKELSITPDSAISPYAMYNAEVTATGYNDVIITNMPVFEGVLSVQRVALVPAIGQNDTEIIPESEPDLNGGA